MHLDDFRRTIAAGRELEPSEITAAAAALTDPNVPAAAKEAFLEALALRGETAGEIAGFAREFRERARDPGLGAWAVSAIDVCGTGGDRSGSFNISTVVAFVLAASGVPVIKHGNRSITSHCGSADLLEALGLRIDAAPDQLRRSMETLGFAFLFAPAYHPAFKEIGPVRRALAARGQRTVFNVLGPLLNPGRPAFQIMGVFAEGFVAPVAGALDALGLEAGFAVHGAGPDGCAYDELTVLGRNRMAGFGRLRGVDQSFTAADMGLAAGDPAGLAGGGAAANVGILERLVAGEGPETLVNTVALNAAAGFFAAGRVASVADGVAWARETLEGGAVAAWLGRAREFYQT
jgi:anthranilate phosphoribosyltransferase